ncbi:hypothetical protein C8R46DRAFT_1059909 [Mycena filopes]|nr:hypothetical protein C8R46DRAFT_1059909 [Mycena filopes]
MKAGSLLPVHRTEKRLAFNAAIQCVPTSPNRLPLVGRIKNSTIVGWAHNLWRVCTTSLDGSLSETFRLSSEDSNRTSASSRLAAQFGDGKGDTDFLEAVVVERDEHGLLQERSGQSTSSRASGQGGSNSAGMGMHRTGFRGWQEGGDYQGGLKSWALYRGWPAIVEFFEPSFPEHEEEFQRQTWHSVKFLAFVASLFLVLNWMLYLILNNESNRTSPYGRFVYWIGFTLATIPTPFMIALDMPRKFPVTFQLFFCLSVWYCAFAELIQMRVCHFFIPGQSQCSGKDFLAAMYYSTAYPALMMFIISKRLYNFIAQIVFFVLLLVLIVPVQGIYARNVVAFAVFSLFVQGLHYMLEDSRRTMFLLALQLKQAFKAKHKARLAESKASFTKRRFANYIFHEVRVPLNNAVLAFQLLQAGNAFKPDFARSTEVYALDAGLKMMKTVLNDVLDFEKMDSGHFATVPRPFPLHHSIRAVLEQVEAQTGARHLVLERALDARIDGISSVSSDPSTGGMQPEGLWVLGNQLRLQQVLMNLATNAVKYTPAGSGSVRISTEFLGVSIREELPGNPPDLDDEQEKKAGSGAGAGEEERPAGTRCLEFRLVVHDSGPGIKASDLIEDRLFQPFIQTAVGQTSGSGTGLGLAIVKEIVRLSGGRLGVKSRRGEGSKFWIEMSYPIASAAEIQAARDANIFASADPPPFTSAAPSLSTAEAVEQSLADGPSASAAETDATIPEILTDPDVHQALSVAPLTPLTPVLSSNDPLLVLVVDDDAVTRVLSSKLLTKLGCVVHTAKDGQECVDMVMGAEPHTYDLVCLDNFMPVMKGEEAVREIRTRDRDDFIVGCTGNALTEDQDSYREAGADEVMVKPVMIHDFKRLIQLAHQRRLERRTRLP